MAQINRTDIPDEDVGYYIDRRTMVWERRLNVDMDRVWAAVSKEEELEKWLWETKMDFREGGTYEWIGGGWGGTISELRSKRVVQFQISDDEGRSVDAFQRFEIIPDGEGCLFKFTDRMGPTVSMGLQPGGPGTHWVEIAGYWHGYVDRLEAYVQGNPFTTDRDEAKLQHLYRSVVFAYHAANKNETDEDQRLYPSS